MLPRPCFGKSHALNTWSNCCVLVVSFHLCSVSGKTASVAHHSQLSQLSELRCKIGKRFFHIYSKLFRKGYRLAEATQRSFEFTTLFNNIPCLLFTSAVERRRGVTPCKCMKARQCLTKAGTYRHADRMYLDVPCFITSASVEPQIVTTK